MRKGKSSEASWLEMVEGDYTVLTDLCVHPHRTASGYLYRVATYIERRKGAISTLLMVTLSVCLE